MPTGTVSIAVAAAMVLNLSYAVGADARVDA